MWLFVQSSIKTPSLRTIAAELNLSVGVGLIVSF
jgi:hypothetical protein